MFNKKGVEIGPIVLGSVAALIILIFVFFGVYKAINLQTDDLLLRSYSEAEYYSVDNELHSILFGNSNLANLIIEGEVLDRKEKIDSEINKILRDYKSKNDRDYSFIINYKDKGKIVYGDDLSGSVFINKIESSLKLPSFENENIEVKLVVAFSDYTSFIIYYLVVNTIV